MNWVLFNWHSPCPTYSQLNVLEVSLEREIIAEEFDNGLPRVVEMIAKEVDDERRKRTAEEIQQ